MTSKSCSSCFRALQRRSRLVKSPRFINRAFSTTSTYHVDLQSKLPELNQTPGTEIPPVTPKVGEGGPKIDIASNIATTTPKVFTTYTAYGVTELLYKECGAQADYKIEKPKDEDAEVAKTADGEDLGFGSSWWHKELGLPATFSTWSQVTMLHMYLLSARFRCFPGKEASPWQQHLLDHFFYDAENKMTINHNMHARGTRNKYLKDMFVQWRGLLAAYDEGLVKGDAVLAAAVWRNVFKAKEDVDIKGLALIVSYMRRLLKELDELTDEQVMRGELAFGSPKDEISVLRTKSPMMVLPFERAPGKDLPGKKGE